MPGVLINSVSFSAQCVHCLEGMPCTFPRFDTFLTHCAHTFCLRCLYDLKNKAFICPTCRNEIKSEKPNVNKLFLATTTKIKAK